MGGTVSQKLGEFDAPQMTTSTKDRDTSATTVTVVTPSSIATSKRKARKNATHARRRAAGLCIQCGKAPPIDEQQRCEGCREKNRQRERARDRTPYSSANYHANEHKYRDWRYRKVYGITLEDYERILAEQGGLCAICGTDQGGGRGDRFHIDHDHATGKVRGLLCLSCNRGIGCLGDDPTLLTIAVAYLER